MSLLFSLLAGLVFGIGLIVSGMSNPAKVLGFLDLAGKWDPSLALVMAGAIAVAVGAYAIAQRRQTTWLGLPMLLPAATHIDRRICPGPALVLAGAGLTKGLLFVAAMLAGMALFEVFERLNFGKPATG
jgi:hypothetical protein